MRRPFGASDVMEFHREEGPETTAWWRTASTFLRSSQFRWLIRSLRANACARTSSREARSPFAFLRAADSESSSAPAAAPSIAVPSRLRPTRRGRVAPPVAPARHSERCRECKIRVRELLERIYGTCLPNHRFRWPTDLAAYSETSIYPTLRNVASALEAFRGYAVSDFAKSKVLAPCDFWIPNPGFVVEFDESQHFTHPRGLSLSAYPHEQPMGFSAARWIGRCEHHDAKDKPSPLP